MKDDKIYALRRMNCYRVDANEDQTEGRGRSFIVGYFDKHVDAVNAATGKGGMGTIAPVHNVIVDVFVNLRHDTNTIGGQLFELVDNWDDAFVVHHAKIFNSVGPVKYHRSWIDPQLARAQALSKLTDEEQKLLGLKKKTPNFDIPDHIKAPFR